MSRSTSCSVCELRKRVCAMKLSFSFAFEFATVDSGVESLVVAVCVGFFFFPTSQLQQGLLQKNAEEGR
jgi:O-antigen/teichoic acid export membrane protein